MKVVQLKFTAVLLLLTGIALGLYILVWNPSPGGLSKGQITLPASLQQTPAFASVQKNAERDTDVLSVAKRVSESNKTILVTMINDAYLPFTYSWLCNTKSFNIHSSVLIITTDQESKKKLNRDWPEIHVVAMEMAGSQGDQVYSRVGYVQIMVKRTEMLLTLLQAGLEVFLFEVDCLWLADPITDFQTMEGYDMLVNPVAERSGVYAGGFLYMYNTTKTRALWTELTNRMVKLGERIKSLPPGQKISEGDNDQIYFSSLITSKFAGIKVKELPLDKYADGKWYSLPEAKRKSSRPLVINNNWVEGNPGKIARAKKWGHWFVKEDNTCDLEQVKKVIY